MTVSIITAAKNSSSTIGRTIKSVASQNGVQYEHIIKDGSDEKGEIYKIKELSHGCKLIFGPDKGIYDAMNIGYQNSTGEIIGFLNSDDYYYNSDVLRDVVSEFLRAGVDFVYGNIICQTHTGKVVRHWNSSNSIKDGRLVRQIPHPGIFVSRRSIEKIGLPFDSNLKLAADLKQQLCLIEKCRCNGIYINKTISIMEMGGASNRSLKSHILGWREAINSYNEIVGGGGLRFCTKKVFQNIKEKIGSNR